MTQQITIGARLSPATTGAAIGYRVEELDGTVYAAFTQTNVAETDVAGTWLVSAPVTIPDGGAVVYWGTSGGDVLAEIYGPVADVNVATVATDAITSDAIASSAVDEINAAVDVALVDYDAATGTEAAAISSAIAALNNLSAADVRAQIDAALSAAGGSITVVSIVSGARISVRQGDTWRFTVNLPGATLTIYDSLFFAVKDEEEQLDSTSILYVKTGVGLTRVNAAPPDSAANGALSVDSDTAFSVVVHMAETLKISKFTQKKWFLKAFDDGTPDEGYTLAEGLFVVSGYGIGATT